MRAHPQEHQNLYFSVYFRNIILMKILPLPPVLIMRSRKKFSFRVNKDRTLEGVAQEKSPCHEIECKLYTNPTINDIGLIEGCRNFYTSYVL